ncbi:sensor histidine kinase [Paenibacillaceae bacterium WGS1546]|uniref:sensor histidine kinase n=1 Tax=Cohnella sp. WGS1546 TaxID=3366810 RepID=UPI00372D5F49
MRQPFRSRLNSIKVKLSAVLLLLFLSFMSVTVYLWYSSSAAEAEREAGKSSAAMINVSNDNLENTLKDIDKIVALISVNTENYINSLVVKYAAEYDRFESAELIRIQREIQDYLVNVSTFKHYLAGLTVSDLAGRTIDYGITTPFADRRSQSWFGGLSRREDEAIVVPPHYTPLLRSSSDPDKGRVISIVRPIVSGGAPVGFVAADVHYEVLEDLFETNVRNTGELLILDEAADSFILDTSGQRLSSEDLARLKEGLAAEEGSFNARLAGTDTFVVHRDSAFTKWTTLVLIPRESLLAASSAARDKMLVVSLLFSAAAVILILFAASLMTRNLMKLRRAMMDIDRDNLDVSLRIDSKDEIGQLSRQFNAMSRRIRNLVAEVRTTERERGKAELRALQAQINPHFLHNTLNTIKFLSLLQGADNIKLVAESLSTLMHGQMDARPFVSVDEEVRYLESYLSIQKYRYNDKFQAVFHVEDGVGQLMTPKMLLQPIVENALLHGIAPLKTQGAVQIKIYAADGRLVMRVQDNGVGMAPGRLEELLADGSGKSSAADGTKNSIGLRNVQARIKGIFGESFGLIAWSEEHRFTAVQIEIPALTEEEAKPYA